MSNNTEQEREQLAKQLVDKYVKSFGDNEIPIDEMYYNESKSNGINMRSFLEDLVDDVLQYHQPDNKEVDVIKPNDTNYRIELHE